MPDAEKIIEAARSRDVAVFVVDRPPAHYFLYRFGISEEFRQTEPLYGGRFHRAVRKGDAATLRLLEKGFAAISDSEYREIDRRWMGETASGPGMIWYLQVTLVAAGIVSLFLLVMIGALRRMVRRRTVALQEQMEITQARAEHADRRVVVLFTLVREKMASMVERYCVDKQIPFANILGDALKAIEQATGHEADEVVMRPVAVEADYFDRISAMEFAVRTDDGVAPDALRDCDICLIGASRSGKTPLSLYLGYVGYKTMNVPLVPGIKPPDELFQIERWRIVGLTIDPERLLQIRSRRAKTLGGYGTKDGGYADLVKIYDELEDVRRIQRSLGCPVIDTTGLALEEAAARVTDIVEDRARKAGTQLRRLAGSPKIAP